MNKPNINYWLRVLHRDIGYFAVGLTLVYALSGFFLSHSDWLPGTRVEPHSIKLSKALGDDGFRTEWAKRGGSKIVTTEVDDVGISFELMSGEGYYSKADGLVEYEIFFRRPFIRFLNQLHTNYKDGWIWVADVFVIVLIFLAISGLFIVRGKNGFAKRGIWLMLAGIVLILIFNFVN